MTFSKPLDPATAQDLKNYEVSPQTRAAGDGTVRPRSTTQAGMRSL